MPSPVGRVPHSLSHVCRQVIVFAQHCGQLSWCWHCAKIGCGLAPHPLTGICDPSFCFASFMPREKWIASPFQKKCTSHAFVIENLLQCRRRSKSLSLAGRRAVRASGLLFEAAQQKKPFNASFWLQEKMSWVSSCPESFIE